MGKKSTGSKVSYSGAVKIKVLSGTKVVKSGGAHNSGSLWLFRVLASALLGNDERRNMPHYLNIFDVNGDTETPILSNRVALTSGSFSPSEDGGVMATFTAIIPYKSIADRSTTHRISRIKIYSDASPDSETTLATVDTGAGDVWDINSGTRNNIAIEWDMTFANQSSEVESEVVQSFDESQSESQPVEEQQPGGEE